MYRGRGGDGGRHRAGLICFRHRLELLVDPGGGGQIELTDLLFIEPEPGRSGRDPLPVRTLVILAKRQIEPQIALAFQQGDPDLFDQRNGAEQLVHGLFHQHIEQGEEAGDEGLLGFLGRGMGVGQQFAEAGPDHRHLIELGTLAVAGAGGGDQGHEAFELGVAEIDRRLAKGGDGVGVALEVVDVTQQLEGQGDVLTQQLLDAVEVGLGLVDHVEQLHHHHLGRLHGRLLDHLGSTEEEALEQVDAKALDPFKLCLVLHLLRQIGELELLMLLDEHLDLQQRRGAQIELDDVDVGEEALPIGRQGEVVEGELIAQPVQLFDLGQQRIVGIGIFQDLDHHLLRWQALGQPFQQQGVREVDEAGAAAEQLIDVLLQELFDHQSGGGLLGRDGGKHVIQTVAKQQLIGVGVQLPIQDGLPCYV